MDSCSFFMMQLFDHNNTLPRFSISSLNTFNTCFHQMQSQEIHTDLRCSLLTDFFEQEVVSFIWRHWRYINCIAIQLSNWLQSANKQWNELPCSICCANFQSYLNKNSSSAMLRGRDGQQAACTTSAESTYCHWSQHKFQHTESNSVYKWTRVAMLDCNCLPVYMTIQTDRAWSSLTLTHHSGWSWLSQVPYQYTTVLHNINTIYR